MDQLQIVRSRNVNSLYSSLLDLFDHVLLTNYHEIRLVSQQREHDQISIRTIETMARIRIVSILQLQISDVVHHLVFTLSWDA